MIAHNRDGARLAQTAAQPRLDHRAFPEEDATVARIRDTLAASGYRALQEIEIEHHDGRLVLRGSVPSFYLKQLAQHAGLEMPEIQEIDNQLQVQPGEVE